MDIVNKTLVCSQLREEVAALRRASGIASSHIPASAEDDPRPIPGRRPQSMRPQDFAAAAAAAFDGSAQNWGGRSGTFEFQSKPSLSPEFGGACGLDEDDLRGWEQAANGPAAGLWHSWSPRLDTSAGSGGSGGIGAAPFGSPQHTAAPAAPPPTTQDGADRRQRGAPASPAQHPPAAASACHASGGAGLRSPGEHGGRRWGLGPGEAGRGGGTAGAGLYAAVSPRAAGPGKCAMDNLAAAAALDGASSAASVLEGDSDGEAAGLQGGGASAGAAADGEYLRADC